MLVDVQGAASTHASPYLHLVVGCVEQYDALCGSSLRPRDTFPSMAPLEVRFARLRVAAEVLLFMLCYVRMGVCRLSHAVMLSHILVSRS